MTAAAGDVVIDKEPSPEHYTMTVPRQDDITDDQQHIISNPTQAFAFLNHSTTTFAGNSPPDVDDRPLARQRRRRTSPEDQTILENAFSRNSKPDKAARLEIVKQVALGEKEVQIWFQNRRQSSRRRSRPLLPHEIAQYQMARSSGCVAQSSSPGLQDFAPTVAQHTVSGTTSGRQPIPGEQHPVSYPGPDGLASDADVSFVTAPGRSSAVEPVRTASSIQVLDIEGVETVAQDHRARRSDQSLDSESVRLLPAPAAVREAPKTLRLTMTSEGKAEVTCKSASSPSPPRPHQVGDNQHVSTVPLLDPLLGGKDVSIQPLKRASSGRSRDSRAWEFWCDKDARGELEYKADKDASGSAADAIGLLRSNSGRRVLGSLPAKRNIQQSRSSVNPKRHKHGGEKTGLQRSVTHDAKVHRVMHRAQNGTLSGLPTSSIPGNQKRVPGNDSDKENWSPEGLASEDRGAAATDSSKVPSRHTMSSNRSYDQSFTFVEPSDVVDPEEDPEIAAFMNTGRRSSSVSGEEEMDCVHGLLSLSQGNWR